MISTMEHIAMISPSSEQVPSSEEVPLPLEEGSPLHLSQLRALLEICAYLEANAGTSAVQLRNEAGEPLGSLVIDGGRVCFARRHRERPASGRLRHRLGDASPALRERIAAARERGGLTELLLTLGDDELGGRFQTALFELVAAELEAIQALCPTRLRARWRPLDGTLHPRFSFSFWDVYRRIAERAFDLDTDSAGAFFLRMREKQRPSLYALRDGDGVFVPLCSVGLESPSLVEVVQLGRSLQRLVSPPALSAANITPTALFMRGDGSTWSVVSSKNAVCIAAWQG